MKNYFINPETGLLRAGWRIFAFVAVFMAVNAVVMLGVRAMVGGLPAGGDLQMVLLLFTSTLSVFIARKYFDRKSMKSLGLHWDLNAVLDIIIGILNSAAVMAGIYFTMLWTGLIEFSGFSWWTDDPVSAPGFQLAILPVVLAVLLKLTIVAWWEELVFRGYFVRNMMEGMGLMWTVILSSLIFGGGHFFNPDATLLSSILIALITPQLIYAYLKSGQLWLPMGIHLGWNFFQASIFGFASSGQVSPSLIAQSPVGPEWLSGGAFGAEGSIIMLPFTLMSLFLIHYGVRITRQPDQKFFEIMK